MWTGSSVIVVGTTESAGTRTTEAASYDIARDEWVMLPAPPVGAGVELEPIVWTGREIVVLGSRRVDSNQDDAVPVVAFDPARETWRTTAASPLSLRSGASAAWTGQEVLVWGGEAHGGFTSEPFADGAAYSPGEGR